MGKWIALGVVVMLAFIAWGNYNGLVRAGNAVDKAWSDVEAVYQRRLNTIPKFVKTAQFSADFQIRLQREYVQGREGIKSAAATGDPAALQKAANDAYGALVIAVRAEAVPQAKTEQLTELNAQVESVERAVNHELKAFNGAVMNNNNKVQTFPGNVFAAIFGFRTREGFKAEPGAEKSPDFDLKLN